MKAFRSILALAAALLLCLGLCAPVFAGAEAEDPSWDEITAKVMEEYNMTESGVFAGYLNLVTGEEHYINGDEYASAASMFKLPLCMCVTEELNKGNIDWSIYEPYFSFESVLNDVLIESSNQQAMFLCDTFLGGYNEFRLKTASYMGVEAGSERMDITMYNNYTPREFISCLKLLYNEPERFPNIIETMQKAMTNQFFKLNEPRFRIAHKPGWIPENYVLDDCALCFTTQPIALVMMTRSASTSEEFLSAWCTAMCEYTEKLANKPEPTPEPTPVPTPTPAPVVPTPEPVPDRVALPTIVPAAAIGAFLILGLILIIVLCAKYHARFLGLFLALILSAGVMLLSAAGMYYGTIYAKPDGDPVDSVTTFFDAVCAGDYATAYTQLRDYADLGLGERPTSPAAQKVCDALHASYAYSLSGECRTDKLTAEQTVRFVHLDLAQLEQAVAEETQRQVEAIVQSRPTSAVYDENKRYRSEVADEAYLAALDTVLRDAQAYYSEAEFNLSLAYVGGRWQIIANPSLLRALAGGIGY